MGAAVKCWGLASAMGHSVPQSYVFAPINREEMLRIYPTGNFPMGARFARPQPLPDSFPAIISYLLSGGQQGIHCPLKAVFT